MLTLIEKIEANAAQRLPIPPNSQPAQELARYRNYLKVETHRLKILHRGGWDGRKICQARASVVDALLRYLLEGIKATSPVIKQHPLPPLALVAIGGYGRQELNPHSDIDIMFLHHGEVLMHGKHRACMMALTEGMLLSLYDIGLKVGHSVRNVEDCVKVANSDMQSKTSLIEARLITGDAVLFDRMQNVVLAKCIVGFADTYISERLKDQTARRVKYGDSACMQEPNIKNGCGGLRDYQNLLWMAYFKYRVRSLTDLQKREWISEAERRQLEAAYDYLLRVRNELHYQANRAMDVLLKSLQPTVAHYLGYTDRSPIKRLESCMRMVYLHMRNVYLITRTAEERLALLQKPKPRTSIRDFFRRRKTTEPVLVDGFHCVDGEILAGTPRVFRDQPRRLMRVFLYAQQRGVKLNADLAQLIRQELRQVNHGFLRDPHVHETFLEIISQRGNVAPVLRAMHEVGLLGRYLPEFGKLTCLVQHEFFHRYTADEHTLVCLEMLDKVWAAKQDPFQRYVEIFQKIERPFILYLALLLHDAGKAIAIRRHVPASSKQALKVARRLNLDTAATHTLCLLIENHLAMVQISQQRDLEDATVSRKFAQQIETTDNLALLLLHTFADSLGTSTELWSGFKEALVTALYNKTLQVLQGGAVVAQAEEKLKESLFVAVRRQLPRNFAEDELLAHFTYLPPRYFQIHSASDIHTDLGLAHQFMLWQVCEEDRALEPVLEWTNEPDRGYASVRVCTWDRPGLFSKIAGSLTAANLNILSARVFSRADGMIFDTFYVQDAGSGLLPNRETQDKFRQVLNKTLTTSFDLASLLMRQKVGRALYPYLEGEHLPTVIRFDNNASDYYTVIDVETEDRVGLLFTISRTLSEMGLDIFTAKICTEKGAALDSFYLREQDGSKIIQPERPQYIENLLRVAIAKLDLPHRGG